MHAAAEMRFYGAHIVAERILQLRAALMQTVVSQEWIEWVQRATAKIREEAAAVKAFLLDEKEFLGRLEIMTTIFQPVVDLLRLTDSMELAASKVLSVRLSFTVLHWSECYSVLCKVLQVCVWLSSSAFLSHIHRGMFLFDGHFHHITGLNSKLCTTVRLCMVVKLCHPVTGLLLLFSA